MIRDFLKYIIDYHTKASDLNNFKQVRWIWGDIWKTWLLQNYDQLETKTIILKTGLDSESCKIVDTICERLFFISPWQRYSNRILCNKSLIISDIEELQQREITEKYHIDQIKEIYKLPKEYYPPSTFYYDDGLKFVPKNVMQQIENKDFIDGGAWIGDTALAFLKYKPNRIFSFEPVKLNYELLEKTIILGELEGKIVPVKMGIGASESTVTLFGNFTDASIHKEVLEMRTAPERQVQEIVKITSIDNFVESNGVEPGLIKLDVEGNELDAIKGAIKTILKYKPLLLISVYHTPTDFFEIKPYIEAQCPGYTFMVRRLDPFHPTAETILIGHYKEPCSPN